MNIFLCTHMDKTISYVDQIEINELIGNFGTNIYIFFSKDFLHICTATSCFHIFYTIHNKNNGVDNQMRIATFS